MELVEQTSNRAKSLLIHYKLWTLMQPMLRWSTGHVGLNVLQSMVKYVFDTRGAILFTVSSTEE